MDTTEWVCSFYPFSHDSQRDFSMTHALICLLLNLLSRAALDSFFSEDFIILIDLIINSIFCLFRHIKVKLYTRGHLGSRGHQLLVIATGSLSCLAIIKVDRAKWPKVVGYSTGIFFFKMFCHVVSSAVFCLEFDIVVINSKVFYAVCM